jgi:hypothetical protein
MKAYITVASVATLSVGLAAAAPAMADVFFFSTGDPDHKLASLSAPANSNLETETADDFGLTDATVISKATIQGLIPSGVDISSIQQVEVEIYRVFPKDSDTTRTQQVNTRVNSPSDVEIGAATRDSGASPATLSFQATLEASFTVMNTVVKKINPKPNQFTGGEGAVTGEEVEIDITFTPPIFLPADHYFFRPEVEVSGGNFLYLSAPRPILSPPGTPFPAGFTDLQSWIRNTTLKPDWSRIGTDIISTPEVMVTFNAAFSLAGDTIPGAGTPGRPNCHGQTISAMAREFGGIAHAAMSLGYFSVDALQEGVSVFCLEPGGTALR